MRAAGIAIAAIAIIGALAPVLANDRPIVAKIDGTWRFPALRTYLGDRSPAPGGRSWKDWWHAIQPGSSDLAIMPPVIWGPFESDTGVNAPPSWTHPLGTDDTGRDQLARLLHGAGTAIWVGLGSVLMALLIGIPLGALAGLRGGLTDHLISRAIEVFLCFPALFLVLVVGAFAGSTRLGVICVLGAVYWTAFARIVRGEFLSLRQRAWVLAARGLGVGRLRLLIGHMLPAVRGPIFVTAAFTIGNAIIVEATLAFLGLGSGPQAVSWGAMLRQGKDHAHEGAWHLWLFPALVVAMTIWALHGLGDRPRRGVILEAPGS